MLKTTLLLHKIIFLALFWKYSILTFVSRYAFYLANYAEDLEGPHSLIEMDENRSDVSKGVIALKNVAREAGVEKLTGEPTGKIVYILVAMEEAM